MNKESFVVSCIRRLREYGEGIILADQAISSLLDVVKANVYTVLCLSQTSQKDRREVISVLGLDARQAETTNYLETGQGIIRLAGRYPLPQLLRFPFIKPANLSDSKLDKMNTEDKRVGELLQAVIPADQMVYRDQADNPPACIPEKPQETKKDKKFESAKKILLDIDERFDVPSTQRAREFNLSGSTADAIFKFIEAEQLAEVVKINLTGKRGGMAKYFSLARLGYEAIRREPPEKSGGTGATHFFLERYLEKYLPAKGFSELVIEKKLEGKRIDLFGMYQGLRVGIEICCSTFKTEFINVQKDIDQCDMLIIVAVDQKKKRLLDKELYSKISPREKLKTCVVSELLNHPEQIITGP